MNRNSNLLAVAVMVTILLASTYAVIQPSVKPVEAQAQQFPREQRNWEYAKKDATSSNYNPQTQINKGNVHLLELKWMYPFPEVGTYQKNQIGISLVPGSYVSALIVDGIIYAVDNNKNVIAINAENGKRIWINEYKVNLPELARTLPINPGAGSHIHAANYINGWITYTGHGCQVRAVDALTGKDAWTIKDTCLNIPGNYQGKEGSSLYGSGDNPPPIYKNIAVVPVFGGDGTSGGRSFVAGYDISTNPPKLAWRTFMTPPAEGDRDWALRDCDKGWFFSEKAFRQEGKLALSCEEVRRVCEQCLLNDWGVPKPFPWASSVSNVWGQLALDEETGIVYFGTGNPTPVGNVTKLAPGPLLYSASIVAVDALTGKIVWWFQQHPRGMTSNDCSWSIMLLTKVRIDGQDRKAIAKGCKAGATFAILDAATGRPLRIIKAPNHEAMGGPSPHLRANDPRSMEDMTKGWCGYPDVKTSTQYCYLSPEFAFYTDNAYDGKTLYFISNALVSYRYPQTYYKRGDTSFRFTIGVPGHPQNHTVYAWDVDAGKAKWGYFIDGFIGNGGVVTSGGVVYWAAASGFLYAFDADTGKVLSQRFHGSPVREPTIGMTAGGKVLLLTDLGGKGSLATGPLSYVPVPGALLAYGLPDKIPEPQVITKEVIKEVPKEVVKEVIKEVPKEVVKEVIKEVIKEVPKEVIKEVPKTVTVETISPISYAAIGIAVVVVVIAGVMMSRRKKA